MESPVSSRRSASDTRLNALPAASSQVLRSEHTTLNALPIPLSVGLQTADTSLNALPGPVSLGLNTAAIGRNALPVPPSLGLQTKGKWNLLIWIWKHQLYAKTVVFNWLFLCSSSIWRTCWPDKPSIPSKSTRKRAKYSACFRWNQCSSSTTGNFQLTSYGRRRASRSQQLEGFSITSYSLGIFSANTLGDGVDCIEATKLRKKMHCYT